MPKGNPNPSPATRFGAGSKGNPIGKTSEQRAAEIKNAWIATELRTRALEAAKAALANVEANGNILDHVDLLKLIKDSEERGLGAPKANLDLTNSDGSLRSRQEDEVLAALSRVHGDKPNP